MLSSNGTNKLFSDGTLSINDRNPISPSFVLSKIPLLLNKLQGNNEQSPSFKKTRHSLPAANIGGGVNKQ